MVKELKEIFNPKNLKRKGDYSELIKIAELIHKYDKAEVPNSATISMAMSFVRILSKNYDLLDRRPTFRTSVIR